MSAALKVAPSTVWIIRSEREWLSRHAECINGNWFCQKTGEEIIMIPFERSIWTDDLGPCAGEGDVQPVFSMYCPACQNEPKIKNGSSIQEKNLMQAGNGVG